MHDDTAGETPDPDRAATCAESSSEPSPSAFVAASPRHILISAALASTADCGENHLYYLQSLSTESTELIAEAVRSWEASPFETVTVLRHTPSDSRLPRTFRRREKREFRAENRARLKSDIARLRPARVYVGTDKRFETMFALWRGKRENDGCVGIFFEDGTGAYAHTVRTTGFVRRFLFNWRRKWNYGWWWDNHVVMGSSRYVDEVVAALPDLVVPALKRKRVRSLDVEYFRSDGPRRLAALLAGALGLAATDLSAVEIVVVLTTSRVARTLPRHAELVEGVLREANARGLSVAIKAHPREPRPEFMPSAWLDSAFEIPAAMPFELLALLLGTAIVVGDVSTSLFAAKWLRPSLDVVSLAASGDHREPGGARNAKDPLHGLLRAVGVRIESDPSRVFARSEGRGVP